MIKTSTISPLNPVIARWSGGITSAVTCYLCIEFFGVENVRVLFIDTYNEDQDTYRFKADCEKWYGLKIESISNPKYTVIEDVWYEFLSLNTATGAICSTELKRAVRVARQRDNPYAYQAFGFEITEVNRALAMKKNNPDANPIFPLIYELFSKEACLRISASAGIEPPKAYKLGYNNNNCLQTGCVQGGVGYWQKIQRDAPEKFDRMARIEHNLTKRKGKPVTMLKDQGKNGGLVFLKHNPDYPDTKDISMLKGRPSKPLMECNGFCGTNDLGPKNETEKELAYD